MSRFATTKSCCFFGHRDADAGIQSMLYAVAEKHITQYKGTTFYVGGYGDFDRMSVCILHELKQKYPHIETIFVVAYLPTGKELEYDRHLYSETLYPEGLETVPRRFAVTHRNRWMVEHSDYLIAYVRKGYGCARTAMRFALKKGKQVINLYDCII